MSSTQMQWIRKECGVRCVCVFLCIWVCADRYRWYKMYNNLIFCTTPCSSCSNINFLTHFFFFFWFAHSSVRLFSLAKLLLILGEPDFICFVSASSVCLYVYFSLYVSHTHRSRVSVFQNSVQNYIQFVRTLSNGKFEKSDNIPQTKILIEK